MVTDRQVFIKIDFLIGDTRPSATLCEYLRVFCKVKVDVNNTDMRIGNPVRFIIEIICVTYKYFLVDQILKQLFCLIKDRA